MDRFQEIKSHLPTGWIIKIKPGRCFSGSDIGTCRYTTKEIWLKNRRSQESLNETLAHEIAHSLTSDGHGKQFIREYIRLRCGTE